MSTPGTKIIDLGFKKIVATIQSVATSYVTVGVQGDQAGQTDGKSGATLAEIATANEFGTDRIPARSFIRSTMDESRADIANVQQRAFAAVVTGQRSVHDGLSLIGMAAQAKIQAKISSNIPPPNAPSTIAAKGSSSTLIDTGQLRQSISFEVHVDGKDH